MQSSFDRLGSSPLGPVCLGIAYFTAALISLTMTKGADGIATAWPPSGILLAALLVVPRHTLWRFAIAGMAASFAANMMTGSGLLLSAGFTSANIIEAMIAALLLRQRTKHRVSFIDPSGLGRFVSASFTAAVASAAIAGMVTWSTGSAFILSWFTTVLLGMLLVTPLVVMVIELITVQRALVSRAKLADLAAIITLAVLANFATFFQNHYPILFVPMIVTVFAVLRAGTLGGVLTIGTATVIGSLAISRGIEPILIANGAADSGILVFQLYLLALFLSALPMASLLAARDRLMGSLAERNRLLDQAEATAHIGHWHLDPGDRNVFWSPEVFRIFGLPVGRQPAIEETIRIYHPDDRPRVAKTVKRAFSAGESFEFKARIVRPDGSIRHVASSGEPDFLPGRDECGFFGVILDITEQVEAQQILLADRKSAEIDAQNAMQLAATDSLTGLANRRHILECLDKAAQNAAKEKGAFSIALIDIDHFKSVNDEFGHDMGDRVLKRVARCAANELRSTDMIGRIGGEEFVLLMEEADAGLAVRIAERVRAKVEAGREGNQPAVTVSLGVATFGPSETAEMLLKRADIALYKAKGSGRNRLSLAA